MEKIGEEERRTCTLKTTTAHRYLQFKFVSVVYLFVTYNLTYKKHVRIEDEGRGRFPVSTATIRNKR